MSYYGTLITPEGVEDFNGTLEDIFQDIGRQDSNDNLITHAQVTSLSPDGALRIILINRRDAPSYEYIIKPEDRCVGAVEDPDIV